MAKKQPTLNRIKIDMGKGVVLSAPFKERMTVSEWRKMTAYIDQLLEKNLVETDSVIIEPTTVKTSR